MHNLLKRFPDKQRSLFKYSKEKRCQGNRTLRMKALILARRNAPKRTSCGDVILVSLSMQTHVG